MKYSKLKQRLQLLLLIVILIPLPGQSDDVPIDKLDHISIVTHTWPNWANEDGTGFYFDLANAIFKPEGIEITSKNQPYLRAKRSVRDNKADAMFAIYHQKSSKSSIITPKYPIDIGETIVAFPAAIPWLGKDALKDQSIIVPRSYYEEFPLDITVKIIAVNGSEAGFQMLLSKRANYFVTDRDEFLYLLKKYNIEQGKFRTEVIVRANLYMGFSNTKKGRELINIFNKNMPKLISDGTTDKLYTKWNLEKNNLNDTSEFDKKNKE